MNPEITVLMPVYNGEKYVGKAIESILIQSFKNFEFLIINDGSTDNSQMIINSYNDPRIVLINNKKNIGLVGSLNLGIKLSKGEFVARMDADDISLSSRLSEQLCFLKCNKNIGVCGTWVRVIGCTKKVNKLPLHDDEIKYYMLFSSPFAHSSVMFRKDVIIKNNIQYNNLFSEAEDYELWFQLGKYTQFANIPRVLLYYRVHNLQKNQLGNSYLRKFSNDIRMLQLYFLYPGINNESVKTHLAICNEFEIKNENELLLRLNWINKIYYEIIDLKNNKYLIEMLHLLFYRQCYISTKSKIYSYGIYKKNKHFKNSSLLFRRRFKLFYSSLLNRIIF